MTLRAMPGILTRVGGAQHDRELPRRVIEYRAPGHLSVLTLLAVIVVAATVAAWRSGDTLPQSVFNSVLVLVVSWWPGYAALFIVAYRITVVEGRVHWSAVVRRGDGDVTQMTSVWSRMPGLARLRFGNERSIAVQTGYGFSRFVAELTSEYPSVRVDTSRLDRIA